MAFHVINPWPEPDTVRGVRQDRVIFPSSDPFVPADIRKAITSRASGVFMWARLVVRRVLELERKGVGWREIEAEISVIPPELDNLYLELVQGMDERPVSLRLIQWVCFATRPLLLDELRWAMAIDPACPSRSS